MCRLPSKEIGFYSAYLFEKKSRYISFENGIGEFVVCGLIHKVYCNDSAKYLCYVKIRDLCN